MVSDPIISVTGSASAAPKSEFGSAPTHDMLQVNLRHLADRMPVGMKPDLDFDQAYSS
jgi:hypothetical protein